MVVSRDLAWQTRPDSGPLTLQSSLDDWADAGPALREVAHALEIDPSADSAAGRFDQSLTESPLPRAYQWADGSAYLNHVELVRRARGVPMPESFLEAPLMYQGGSDSFLGPKDGIDAESEELGIDFEAEVAVVVDDTPRGVGADEAGRYIRLLMLVNDVTYRNVTGPELAKGFGFFQSKPSTAFSPVAASPDELGAAWDGCRLSRTMCVDVNGEPFGRTRTGCGMEFGFPELIAHAARTRRLAAGTIIGSGTISNRLDGRPGKPIVGGGAGFSCIAEQRMVETIEHGEPSTPFLRFGDNVRIWMEDDAGQSIFGDIDQTVCRIGG